MLHQFDGTLNTDESQSQRLEDNDSNVSALMDESMEAVQMLELSNAVYDQCDFKSDLEIIGNQLENDRYQLVERPNTLMVFKNNETEQKYAF